MLFVQPSHTALCYLSRCYHVLTHVKQSNFFETKNERRKGCFSSSIYGDSELSTLSELIVESLVYGPRSMIIHIIEALLVLMAADSLPCLISSLIFIIFPWQQLKRRL
jgi:hypothetical protein